MDNMTVGIYTITSPTNKVYVGQSWNLKERYSDYKKCNITKQRKVYSSIKKHGWEMHHWNVIMELNKYTTQEWMDYWETFFWNYYRNEGYDMLNIKEPGSNGKHSEETKQKISIKNKTTRKLRGYEHPAFGKKFSEEYRRKLSDSHKGKNIGKANGNSRPVIQITKEGEFVKEWDCGREASKSLKISAGGICMSCQGIRPHAGGFIWKYKK